MSRLGGMMMGKRHKEGRTKYVGKGGGGGTLENKIKEL